MKTLSISIDPGGSLTKVVYDFEGQRRYLTIDPEVVILPRKIVESYEKEVFGFNVYPQEQAWIQIKRGQDCYVVGEFAQKMLGVNPLAYLKYERALCKALAAIGCVAQHCQLTEAVLNIVIVLPYGEFHNRTELERQIQSAVKNFVFRGQRYRFNLNSFSCRPEGAGIFYWQCSQRGLEWILKSSFDLLMVGHRNLSYLQFSKGRLHSGTTSDLGINQIIQFVLKKTSGQSEQFLLPILYSGQEISVKSSVVQTALRSQEPRNRAVEAENLVQAIATAKAEYKRLVNEWLTLQQAQRQPSSRPIEILISGGGSHLPEIRTLLAEQFHQFSLNWCNDLTQAIAHKLSLKTPYLAVRLADPYALLDSIQSKTKKEAVA